MAAASSANETGDRTPSSRTTTTWTQETPTVRTPLPPADDTPRSCAHSEYTYTSYSETARSGESYTTRGGGVGAGFGASAARRQLLADDDDDDRGGRLLAPLMDSTHSLLTVVDGAFAWLTEPRDALTRVPAPPRPERRVEALPRGAARNARMLDWRELGELRAALSENSESQKYMSFELNAKDVEAQALAQRGEASLHSKQELLRQLRDRIDATPAARAERLAGLRHKVRSPDGRSRGAERGDVSRTPTPDPDRGPNPRCASGRRSSRRRGVS